MDGVAGASAEQLKHADAEVFVQGSVLLTVIVCLAGVSGLALQALRWCQNLTMWVFVPLVIMYSVLCLFSMFALGDCLVLLRNLGGERARER